MTFSSAKEWSTFGLIKVFFWDTLLLMVGLNPWSINLSIHLLNGNLAFSAGAMVLCSSTTSVSVEIGGIILISNVFLLVSTTWVLILLLSLRNLVLISQRTIPSLTFFLTKADGRIVGKFWVNGGLYWSIQWLFDVYSFSTILTIDWPTVGLISTWLIFPFSDLMSVDVLIIFYYSNNRLADSRPYLLSSSFCISLTVNAIISSFEI